MPPTSEQPQPSHAVLQPSSTPTPPSVLSQEIFEQEQLLKFFIGLRLIGEEKAKRYVRFLASLQPPTDTNERKDENNGI